MDPRLGCEVKPDMASIAPSTASTPASIAAKHAGRRDPAGVMRVEVNRQTHLLLERLDQRGGGARLTQPAHVLDREHVGAHGRAIPWPILT